jgi:hypothetical protein
LKKAKKRIKDRLNKETDGNCKIFYFSGIREDNIYFLGEIKNLTRYLNRVKLITGLIFLNMSPLHDEKFAKMLWFKSIEILSAFNK